MFVRPEPDPGLLGDYRTPIICLNPVEPWFVDGGSGDRQGIIEASFSPCQAPEIRRPNRFPRDPRSDSRKASAETHLGRVRPANYFARHVGEFLVASRLGQSLSHGPQQDKCRRDRFKRPGDGSLLAESRKEQT